MTVDDVCPKHFYNGLHRKAHWATSSQPTVSAKRSVLWSGDTAVFYWREEKNQKGGEQHYESSGDFVKKKKNKKKLKRNTEEFHSFTKMARFLGHGFNVARMNRSSFRSWQKWLSSDALAEIGVAPGEIGIVSGIPQEQLRRRVVIYSPSRTASQQGSGKVGKWKIDFLSTQKWENPLMGWTSTGDPYANVGDATLSFDSEEAAKLFCEKYGWEYVVKKRHTPLLKPKSYADNFKWKGPPKSDNN